MAAPLTSSERLLRRLEWNVLRRLDGVLQGDYRTLWRGGGVDLADLREYQHHDDVRHIDWNVTARLQQPYVRQYTEDRDLTVWFLLDVSGSVDFGSAETTKLAVSAGFVATMARIFTRHGNRVGAVVYGQGVDGVLPPGTSRRHVLTLIQRMLAAPKRGASSAGTAVKRQSQVDGTDLATLLKAADGVIRRRSLVFVVSDFISRPGWAEGLARLARRHELVAVRLIDPMELALPDVGLVTLQDAETGEQLFVDASDPAFRERYADLAQKHDEATMAALADSGADVLELATDDDLLDTLLRMADMRRLRARRKALPRGPAQLRRAAPMAAGTSSLARTAA